MLQTAIRESLPELRTWLRFVQSEPEPLERKVARLRLWRAAFDRDEYFQLGVFPPDESAVWGGVALLPRVGPGGLELSYWLHSRCQGRGLATEAVTALAHVAFRAYRLERIEIHCEPANAASAAVPRRLGFRHEATLRRRLPSVDGTGPMRDRMVWSLWADEFERSPAAALPVRAYDAADAPLALDRNHAPEPER
jgi:RimJ/RimL family protein N-acetyltransferase